MKRLFWLCLFAAIGMADAAEGCKTLQLKIKAANVENAAGKAIASTARTIGMPWRVAFGYIDAAGYKQILKYSISGAWVWISHK